VNPHSIERKFKINDGVNLPVQHSSYTCKPSWQPQNACDYSNH
ncbi:unnamed protein product, partial [Heterotrigona itama]